MMRLMCKSKNRQRGMSLIELMIACFVLVVGMLGSLSLILLAIATNSRNKFDTTGTMLAQTVIEQMNTLPTNMPVSTIEMTDCGDPATVHTVAVVGGDYGIPTGSALIPNSNSNTAYRAGDIDFSEAAPPANYHMMWTTCGNAQFDIRWNVNQITERSRLVTVSARQLLFKGKNANLYAPPITLRTISGP
jgi:Tfp pilus assembly protein PilV